MKRFIALAIMFSILFPILPDVIAKENRMAKARSLYLRLHKDNPIDWYEWGPEAFEKARRENKPLFISIGYFSCHWCHVMNEETFMNEEVGKMMNELFVNIKVDRQEMPDIDQLYMSYLQMTVGSGGWPMSIFAASDGTPFFGGTFFPPHDNGRLPGLLSLGPKIAAIYKENRESISKNSATVKKAFKTLNSMKPSGDLDYKIAEKALDDLRNIFNKETGGFGQSPKFPNETNLQFILEYDESSKPDLDMVRFTLDKMAEGGIYDHIGGGFHRYTVDENWDTPHFEKMIYTNAAMLRLYTSMYRLTNEKRYLNVAIDIATYVAREMYRPGGGFWSAQDADSPGGEGEFYIWSREEFIDILGKDDGELMAEHLGIGKTGRFNETKSVPRMEKSVEKLAGERNVSVNDMRGRIEKARSKLYVIRSKRPAPALEKQALSSWSAMMTRGLIDLYAVTGSAKYKVMAEKTLNFIDTKMTVNGILKHSFVDGKAGDVSYLEDYAYSIAAWLDMFEATQDYAFLKKAQGMADDTIKMFGDKESGGFFITPESKKAFLVRQKNFFDSPTPAGSMQMAYNLLRIYSMTGVKKYRDEAIKTLKSGHEAIKMVGTTMVGTYLRALTAEKSGLSEFALVGKASDPAVSQAMAEIRRAPVFRRVALLLNLEKPDSIPDVHKTKVQLDNKPTLYLCRNFTCDKPVAGIADIRKTIQSESTTLDK